MFKVTVRCQQMDYVSRHSDKEHNCECVSLFVRGWVGVAIAPALALSVPLVLTWPDLSFYPILFDPLPSLLTVPLPRSLLPNSSPPFSATPPSSPLISECPPVHLPCFPFFPNPHLTSPLSLFFLFFGGDWSYCFNPLSLPPFPSQSTPFSCFPPIPFLTALGKLVDLVSPRRTQWSPACCPGNSGYSRTNSIFSKERKIEGEEGQWPSFFIWAMFIKYKSRPALGRKLKCRTLQFQEVGP